MPVSQSKHQHLVPGLNFKVQRVGRYQGEGQGPHIYLPHYQERQTDAARAAEIFIYNDSTFNNLVGKAVGALILPDGVHFDRTRPPELWIRYVDRGHQTVTIDLEIDEENPGVARFSFIRNSQQTGAPVPVYVLHFRNLYYKNLDRSPGQAVVTEIFFESRCFPMWRTEVRKKIVNMLLYTRGLGPDTASNGMISPGSGPDSCNIVNGNHYMNLDLFASDGVGISTALSLHYNSWNASLTKSIEDLIYYNSGNEYDENYLKRLCGWVKGGWHHSYAMCLCPYVLPEDEEGNILRDYIELQTGDGNRIQFRRADDGWEYYPLHRSDAFYGDNNLLLSMKISPEVNGFRLEGRDRVKYYFDEDGALVRISSEITEQSQDTLKPLRLDSSEPGNLLITDSADRTTVLYNTANPCLHILDPQNRELSLTFREIVFTYREYRLDEAIDIRRRIHVMDTLRMPESMVYRFEYDDSAVLVRRVQPGTKDFVFQHIQKDDVDEMKRNFTGRLEVVTFGERIFLWQFDAPGEEKQIVTFLDPGGVKYRYTCLKDTAAVERSTYYEAGQDRHLASYNYLPGTRIVKSYADLYGFITINEYRSSTRYPGSFLLNKETREIEKGGERYTTMYRYWENTEFLHEIIDPSGNRTVLTYYDNGLLRNKIYPELQGFGDPGRYRELLNERNCAFEEWTYNSRGQVETHRNRRGVITRYSYDDPQLDPHRTGLPTGRSITTLELTWKTGYDQLGNILKSFDPVYGGWKKTEYDDLNRIKKEISPQVIVPAGFGENRHEITKHYDSAGRLNRVTDNYGGRTTYEYTLYGELRRTIDVNGGITEIRARDLNGNTLRKRNPRGRVTHYRYDALNRLKKVTSPPPFKGESPIVNELVYEDSEARVVHRFGGRKVVTVKDGLGRTIETVKKFPSADRSGVETGRSYRELHTRVIYLNKGKTVRTEISEKEAARRQPQLVFIRVEKSDEWNRTREVTAQGISTQQMRYDLEDNVVEVIPPNAAIVGPPPRARFEYDALNRLTRKIDSYNVVMERIEYLDAREENGEARIDYFTQDPTEQNQRRRIHAYTRLKDAGRSARQKREVYNKLGKITRQYDRLALEDSPDSPTVLVDYDARGLPVRSRDENHVHRETRYDPLGRVREVRVRGDIRETNTSELERLKQPGPRRQLENNPDYFQAEAAELRTRYFYDNNGNLLRTIDPGGNVFRYTYDGLDRPVREEHPNRSADSSDPARNLFRSLKYDIYNRPVEITSESGILKRIRYNDAQNRQFATIFDFQIGGTVTSQFAWDGKPVSYNDSRNDLSYLFHYDPLRNIQSVKHYKWQGGNSVLFASLNYEHDLAGNRTTLSLDTAGQGTRTIRYKYNSNFSIWDINASFLPGSPLSPITIQYSYKDCGLPEEINRLTGSSLTTAFIYDKIGRVKEIRELNWNRMLYQQELAYPPADRERRIQSVQYRCGFTSQDYPHPVENPAVTHLFQYTRDNKLFEFYERRSEEVRHWSRYFYDAAGRRTYQVIGRASGPNRNFFTGVMVDINSGDSGLNNTWNLMVQDPDLVEFPYLVYERTPYEIVRDTQTYIRREPHRIFLSDYSHLSLDENVKPFYQRKGDHMVDYRTDPPTVTDEIYQEQRMRYTLSGQMESLYSRGGGEDTTYYYIYDGDTEIANLDERGVALEFYICAPGINQRLAVDRGGANPLSRQLEYYHPDYRGSTLFLSRPDGSISNYFGPVGPFGRPLPRPARARTAAFTGTRDGPMELYLLAGMRSFGRGDFFLCGQRMYDPVSHRFLTKDPKGLAEGSNLYGYANNNPVQYVDLNGKFAILGSAILASVFLGGVISMVIDMAFQYYLSGTYDWRQGILAFAAGAIGGGITGWTAHRVALGTMSVARAMWVNFFSDLGISLIESYTRTTAIEGRAYTGADLGRDLIVNTLTIGTMTAIQRGRKELSKFNKAVKAADDRFYNRAGMTLDAPGVPSGAAAQAAKTTGGAFEYAYDFRPYTGKLSFLNTFGFKQAYATDVVNYANASGTSLKTKVHEGIHEFLFKIYPPFTIAQRLELFGPPVRYLHEFFAGGYTMLKVDFISNVVDHFVYAFMSQKILGIPIILPVLWNPIFSIAKRELWYWGVIGAGVGLIYI
ncbi:MAG: hypothetical protein GTO45_21495 [Candidatus Aminicenantes bacterium]|nr:hypothetical protein [Candidatus Aminicenantes bacterium]NIM81331.1 hypothetical protein [Candidatus Aminicenantes bacterium]NIN20741.1 hypothetical protein [Candidatus Aminicenantes bacterium]NIN44519.1 hypothetical protein [Candidatus Aminicenantes bacterium]NIN87339.1 hypothetical protein [Candidatus Aminicenantes bacterium]